MPHPITEPWAISESGMRLVLAVWSRERLHPEVLEAARTAAGDKPLINGSRAEVKEGVAVIPITGPLFRHATLMTRLSGATSYEQIGNDLAAALADESVKSILLRMDSPGGEVRGLQELAARVRAADGVKPVRAYAESQASSAAYWLASATREIVAAPTALLGSIGCRISMVDDTVATHQQGVRPVEVVSSLSPMKGGSPTDGSFIARMQERADYLASMFVDSVAEYRGVSREKVLSDYGQGAELIGQQAVKAGLADRIGDFDSLLAGMQAQARTPARARADESAPAPEMSAPPAPTSHDAPTEVQTMSEQNAAPPPASDAVTIGKAELAELRAIKAAAVAATGCETGLKGALEALKANADRAQAADAKLSVRKVVDSMIAKGQIAPRQRDHYEAQDLADVEAAARVLVASPPARASADPGPAEGGLPPVAGKGKPVPDAVRARARALIAGKED